MLSWKFLNSNFKRKEAFFHVGQVKDIKCNTINGELIIIQIFPMRKTKSFLVFCTHDLSQPKNNDLVAYCRNQMIASGFFFTLVPI